MKKIFFPTLAAVALAISAIGVQNATATKTGVSFEKPADEPTKWVVDKSHSNVKFTVTHLVVSEVDGKFKMFDGSMEHTKADFSDAKISFSVDVNSIDTDSEGRDKHLKGDDFFNVAQYPDIKFVSTSFKPVGGNKYQLAGNLTLHGVTRPVVFETTYGGSVNAMGKTKAGFKAKTTINRFDYGLKWDRATEAGGLVVGKDVELVVNVEMNKM